MLVVEGLNKIFRQGTRDIHAVEGAELHVHEGERIYIHGPSGAGKSTLLQILCGMARPSSGSVVFKGRDIYRLSDRFRSRLRNGSFGFVFQFYHLLPELTVLENVMMPAMIKGGISGRRAREKAETLLEKVKLEGRASHRPAQLSGGEAQRAAIARALINSPDILFCDEPTGNLDSEMSRQVYAIIHSISDENGMGILLVSHQEVNSDFFDSEYYMKDGILERVPGSGEQTAKGSETTGVEIRVPGAHPAVRP